MARFASLVSAAISFATVDALTVVVKDGRVVNPDGSLGPVVGSTTSAIQSKVVDAMFPAVTASDWQNVSLLNSTILRTLELHGDYVGDSQLKIPSLFQLKVFGEIALKPNVTTSDRFGALVVLDHVSYSAVIGGSFQAAGGGGFGAVSLVGCTRCAVRGIRGVSDNHTIGVNLGEENEIANNDVGPGAGRCVWTLATKRAIVHSNSIHDCYAHALDFDAYTSNSIAYNNTCSGSSREGIFVEETSKDNVIVGNTLRDNDGNGLALYSNAVGPVANNIVIGNVMSGNDVGVSAGGIGQDATKHSEGNLFVHNSIFGNKIGANVHHGDTMGDLWIGNENQDTWVVDPTNNSQVAVFDYDFMPTDSVEVMV